jgi:general L-amino acid transport system permease protein
MSSVTLDTRFVRGDFTPEQAPPALIRGPLGWMRDNLFASVTSSILTVATVALLWFLVPPVWNFLIGNAVWSGANREACLEANVGRPVGACWAFIDARFGYLMYGQYPEALRWRVNLVWLMGAIGGVWLLVPRIGAKAWGALYFFVIFPLLSFLLLAGSTTLGLEPVSTHLWGGLLVTLILSVIGIVVSLPLGIVLALGRRSKLPLIKFVCVIYIEFVRAVPLITVLFMANVMLPLFLNPGSRPDALLRVIVGISLFGAAYMAEVVRGGLQALPKGQYEGAASLGLNYWKMMLLIILPQALTIVIPNIVSTFIGLFKDTSLVSIVGIFDLLTAVQASTADANWATPVQLWTGYTFAAMIYFVFCFGMSRYSIWMEKRLSAGKKR